MRYFRFWVFMIVLAAAGFGVMSCKQEEIIEEEPLLLLDEPGEEETRPEVKADNSRCHVCHINYEDEVLAYQHAVGDVSCEDCHGPSDAHCSDEDNITPPDIMFAREKINPLCLGCHPREKLTSLHKSFFVDTEKEKKVCTGCHGEHKLKHRTRRWDKKTRELIEDDKVRMLTDEMLNQK